MNLVFTKSFERSLKKSPEGNRAKEAVRSLIHALGSNMKPVGLGLKKLDDEVWEIRAGLRTRVLFALYPGEIRLLLVGDHQEIRHYLKRN